MSDAPDAVATVEAAADAGNREDRMTGKGGGLYGGSDQIPV